MNCLPGWKLTPLLISNDIVGSPAWSKPDHRRGTGSHWRRLGRAVHRKGKRVSRTGPYKGTQQRAERLILKPPRYVSVPTVWFQHTQRREIPPQACSLLERSCGRGLHRPVRCDPTRCAGTWQRNEPCHSHIVRSNACVTIQASPGRFWMRSRSKPVGLAQDRDGGSITASRRGWITGRLQAVPKMLQTT